MKHVNHEPARQVYRQILAYWERNPNAGDTVEGIAAWWVAEQRLSESVELVQACLEQMVTEALVLALPGPDGRRHYRLNTQKQQELCRRLHQQKSN